jgi:hypothetical protein
LELKVERTHLVPVGRRGEGGREKEGDKEREDKLKAGDLLVQVK